MLAIARASRLERRLPATAADTLRGEALKRGQRIDVIGQVADAVVALDPGPRGRLAVGPDCRGLDREVGVAERTIVEAGDLILIGLAKHEGIGPIEAAAHDQLAAAGIIGAILTPERRGRDADAVVGAGLLERVDEGAEVGREVGLLLAHRAGVVEHQEHVDLLVDIERDRLVVDGAVADLDRLERVAITTAGGEDDGQGEQRGERDRRSGLGG
ncbi:MAG: hypothetical protein HC927_03475 [Deltaproteobacteria bacterium]|nr:hypothetical protein [Deltaproteobacteria bacterium]